MIKVFAVTMETMNTTNGALQQLSWSWTAKFFHFSRTVNYGSERFSMALSSSEITLSSWGLTLTASSSLFPLPTPNPPLKKHSAFSHTKLRQRNNIPVIQVKLLTLSTTYYLPTFDVVWKLLLLKPVVANWDSQAIWDPINALCV